MKPYLSKMIRSILACVLVIGLMPTVAFAEDAPLSEPSSDGTLANEKQTDQPANTEEGVPENTEPLDPEQVVVEPQETPQPIEITVPSNPEPKPADEMDALVSDAETVSEEIQELTLDNPVQVNPDGSGVFLFTAPEDGIYRFTSSGGYVTYGYLYEDSSFTHMVGEGYGNPNFQIDYTIAAGQAVYLTSYTPDNNASYSVQVSQINIIQLEFDITKTVNLSAHEDAWLSFTAPYEGTYTFTNLSRDEYMGPIFLYADLSATTELASSSAGSGFGNDTIFGLTQTLTAGQTVYVKINSANGGETFYVLISDGKNIENGHVEVNQAGFVGTGSFIAPQFSVHCLDVESRWWNYVNYRISGYTDASGNTLTGVPTEEGSYFAILEGTGDYHGTLKASFDVQDGKNIENWRVQNTQSAWLMDGSFYEPSIRLSLNQEGEPDLYLTQGVDFAITGYLAEDGTTPLDGAPTKNGPYYAVVEGLGQYTGSRSVLFTVNDSDNFTRWNVYAPDNVWLENGSIQEPSIHADLQIGETLYELTQNVDFAITGYLAEDGTTPLDGVPAEEGQYYAVVEGLGQYTGSRIVPFWVVDGADLRYWNTYAYDTVWLENGSEGEPSICVYRNLDDDTRQTLTQGVDFAITGYLAGDGLTPLDGVPTEEGDYYAVIEGLGSYHGGQSVWFTVADTHNLTH